MTPADLFDSTEEGREERAAILAESGIDKPEITASAEMHRCEVKAVIRQCYPDPKKAIAYFDEVERRRGKDAAQRLRDDVRAAWKQRRIDWAGQA